MFDSLGNPVVAGKVYAIGHSKQKVVSETMLDIENDVLLIRPKSDAPINLSSWTRVDEIDESMIWVPVDADGNEITELVEGAVS